jgi:hypothetical protein
VRALVSKDGGEERVPADHADRREAEKGRVIGEAETRGRKGGQDGKRHKPDECDTKEL